MPALVRYPVAKHALLLYVQLIRLGNSLIRRWHPGGSRSACQPEINIGQALPRSSCENILPDRRDLSSPSLEQQINRADCMSGGSKAHQTYNLLCLLLFTYSPEVSQRARTIIEPVPWPA